MMLERHYQHMVDLQHSRDIAELQTVCTRFCQEQGFDHFIYGARISKSLRNPSYIVINGYPEEWRQHYEDVGYLHTDPTVTHCFSQTLPLFWQDIDLRRPINHKLFYEAADFGLISGVSLPVHCIRGGTAMLSFSSHQQTQQSQPHFIDRLALSHLFANYLHEAVLRLAEETPELHLNSKLLSQREKECLLWITEGKTSWEISRILNISERTVAFHINNAMRKLDVTNRQQAVARAITLGHIHPQI
jgi:DNA-binding CsgD family transcriptional regulator